jgi:hypothetical protein
MFEIVDAGRIVVNARVVERDQSRAIGFATSRRSSLRCSISCLRVRGKDSEAFFGGSDRLFIRT